MLWLAFGITLLAAVAIIAVGVMYLANPRAATRSFGLPLPEEGANIVWWLRLKGSRDVVSGLVVLAVMVWGGPRLVGIVLLAEALIPLGDMSIILAAKGSAKRAFGIHGLTAALMIRAAIPLISGLDVMLCAKSHFTRAAAVDDLPAAALRQRNRWDERVAERPESGETLTEPIGAKNLESTTVARARLARRRPSRAAQGA